MTHQHQRAEVTRIPTNPIMAQVGEVLHAYCWTCGYTLPLDERHSGTYTFTFGERVDFAQQNSDPYATARAFWAPRNPMNGFPFDLVGDIRLRPQPPR